MKPTLPCQECLARFDEMVKASPGSAIAKRCEHHLVLVLGEVSLGGDLVRWVIHPDSPPGDFTKRLFAAMDQVVMDHPAASEALN